MTARFVEHVVVSQRQKRREIYVSILVARAQTQNSARRARAGHPVETVSDQDLERAAGRMLANLRRVYRPFTLHVAPSTSGGPDERVRSGAPGAWSIDDRFVFAIKVWLNRHPVVRVHDANAWGGLDVDYAHFRRRVEHMDNLALVYPGRSGIPVAQARGVDLMLGGGTDNQTGRLLLSASFEMVFELDRDILHDRTNTVAHEVGHCLGLADTPNHGGDRSRGPGTNGLLDEDRLWIHRAADAGLIRRHATGTTWGSEQPLSYARD